MVQPVPHMVFALHDDQKIVVGTSESSGLSVTELFRCMTLAVVIARDMLAVVLLVFPLLTHSFSTGPLLLEQWFSAGRYPSFPLFHQNCQ